MSKKDKIKIFCLASILFLAILIPVLNKAIPYFRVVIAYEKAEKLIAQENYSDAYQLLKSIYYDNDDYRLKLYKDTHPLNDYCYSRLAYDRGDIEEAYKWFNISVFEFGMDYQTEEQGQAIVEYCNKLEAEYRPIAEEKAKQEEAEKLEHLSHVYPYVGMEEKYIDKTCLGTPSSNVTTGTMQKYGSEWDTRTYYFYKENRCIYSVTCCFASVVSIKDKRNDPEPTASTWSPESDSDPYNASSYRNAERFYEANYGHFDSFEDAEYYYNRHKDD